MELTMVLIIARAYVRKLPEDLRSRGFGELPGGPTRHHWERKASQFHGERSICSRDPPRPPPAYLSIWFFLCILHHPL